jgi:hypothetical protein
MRLRIRQLQHPPSSSPTRGNVPLRTNLIPFVVRITFTLKRIRQLAVSHPVVVVSTVGHALVQIRVRARAHGRGRRDVVRRRLGLVRGGVEGGFVVRRVGLGSGGSSSIMGIVRSFRVHGVAPGERSGDRRSSGVGRVELLLSISLVRMLVPARTVSSSVVVIIRMSLHPSGGSELGVDARLVRVVRRCWPVALREGTRDADAGCTSRRDAGDAVHGSTRVVAHTVAPVTPRHLVAHRRLAERPVARGGLGVIPVRSVPVRRVRVGVGAVVVCNTTTISACTELLIIVVVEDGDGSGGSFGSGLFGLAIPLLLAAAAEDGGDDVEEGDGTDYADGRERTRDSGGVLEEPGEGGKS